MYRFRQILLLVGDLFCLMVGLFIAIMVRNWNWPDKTFVELFNLMLPLFFLGVIILFVAGLYDVARLKNRWNFYQRIIFSATIWVVLGMIYFYILPLHTGLSPKTILVLTAIFAFGLISFWRFFHNKYLSTTFLKTKVILAGSTPETIEIARTLLAEPERGYELIGIVSNSILPENFSGLKIGTKLSDLADDKGRIIADLVVTSPEMTSNPELLRELYNAIFRQTTVVNLAEFYETTFGRVPPFTFSENWFLANLREQQKKIYDRFRLFFDYSFGVLLGLFFVVTFPITALIIKLNSSGPIFIGQERVGRLGIKFKIYKYRTMQALASDGSAETGKPQFAALDDKRVTSVGKILRKMHLDEVPQFINILRGEMGLVGPRPERPEFVAELTAVMPYYSLRNLIKPGITGWAQIRNAYYGTMEENLRKLEYDLFYIKNRGALLDISIILRTMNIVLRMNGR